MANDIDLILKQVEDKYTRENFSRVFRYIQAQTILGTQWKLYEITFTKAETNFKYEHALEFIPTDIIMLSVIGDRNVYFNFDKFTLTHLDITAAGPVKIRFMVGSYKERLDPTTSILPDVQVAGGPAGPPLTWNDVLTVGATSGGISPIVDGGASFSVVSGVTVFRTIAYTWPAADAAASGYVLTSDAAGALSWTNPGTLNITWNNVLSNGATSGAINPVISAGQTLQIIDFSTLNNFVRHDAAGLLTSFDLFGTANTWSAIQTHSADISMTSSADINFGSGSKAEWAVGAFQIFVEELNGNFWRFQTVNQPGSEVVFSNLGVGDFTNFGIGATTVTIGTGLTATNYSILFNGDSNNGRIRWLEASNRFELDSNLQITTLGLGIVHSDAAGILTSSVIDMATGTDTNIAVASPITLTGSTIGFDFSTTNIWTGTSNTFNGDVIINGEFGGASMVYDRSEGRLTLTPENDTGVAGGFLIDKAETVKPGLPQYFEMDLVRTWTDSALITNLNNMNVDDTGLTISSGFNINRLFNMGYQSAGGTWNSSSSNLVTGFFMTLAASQTHTAAGLAQVVGFDITGGSAPTFNSPAALTGSFTYGVRMLASMSGVNSGAGTLEVDNRFLIYDVDFTQIAGFAPETINITILDTGNSDVSQMTIINVAGTINFAGVRIRPIISAALDTVNLKGFHYTPSGGGLSSVTTNEAFLSTSGTWHNQADSVGSFWGAGDDASISYDGADFIIDPDVVGAGRVLIGATGDDDMLLSTITIAGDLKHAGSNIGFFGATAVAQTAAYTQTFATASRTHAALTSAVLTDSTGGAANTTLVAIVGTGDDANINNNFADLIAQVNALRVDITNPKEVLNSVIDDGQIYGLLQ